MKRALLALASACSYFTVVPLGPLAAGPAPDAFALSYLPLVGAFVGAIAGTVGWFASLHVPHVVAAIAAWACAVALTGAIHVDGFLDSCDGLLVTASVERRLEILRDPRHGTFAVVGMAMLAAFWVAALAAIPPTHWIAFMAFSGTLARAAAVANAWRFPYARAGAVTRAFESRPNILVMALVFAALVAAARALGPAAVASLVGALLFAQLAGWWASRRLGGGLTGDVYGAIVVVTEVLVLLAFSVH